MFLYFISGEIRENTLNIRNILVYVYIYYRQGRFNATKDLCVTGNYNAVFASLSLQLISLAQKPDDFSGTYRSALSLSGRVQDESEELDVSSKSAKLKGPPNDISPFTHF